MKSPHWHATYTTLNVRYSTFTMPPKAQRVSIANIKGASCERRLFSSPHASSLVRVPTTTLYCTAPTPVRRHPSACGRQKHNLPSFHELHISSLGEASLHVHTGTNAKPLSLSLSLSCFSGLRSGSCGINTHHHVRSELILLFIIYISRTQKALKSPGMGGSARTKFVFGSARTARARHARPAAATADRPARSRDEGGEGSPRSLACAGGWR